MTSFLNGLVKWAGMITLGLLLVFGFWSAFLSPKPLTIADIKSNISVPTMEEIKAEIKMPTADDIAAAMAKETAAQAVVLAPVSDDVITVAVTDAQCSVPGSVYIDAVGGCVLHVTDRAEIARAIPPETADDPNCKGKPVGFKYDKPVTGPRGEKGIAHMVCGAR